MTEEKKKLVGVFKVMLLSIAFTPPLMEMIVRRWPAWCFDGHGWGFLFALISAGIIVWFAACRWISCNVLSGCLLTILIAQAFFLGSAIWQVGDGWVFVLVAFIFLGAFHSSMFWLTVFDHIEGYKFVWQPTILTLLMAFALFAISALVHQSFLYGVLVLLGGLVYLRRLTKEVKKQPILARAVLVSHD